MTTLIIWYLVVGLTTMVFEAMYERHLDEKHGCYKREPTGGGAVLIILFWPADWLFRIGQLLDDLYCFIRFGP